MPSAGRFAARLNALPRDQLVDVLAHLMAHMCEELPNVRQHADAVLADHVPLLTQHAIDGVLLSPQAGTICGSGGVRASALQIAAYLQSTLMFECYTSAVPTCID